MLSLLFIMINAKEFTDLTAYDTEMKDYYLNQPSHPKDMDWTTSQVEFFSKTRRDDVSDFLEKQGFELD